MLRDDTHPSARDRCRPRSNLSILTAVSSRSVAAACTSWGDRAPGRAFEHAAGPQLRHQLGERVAGFHSSDRAVQFAGSFDAVLVSAGIEVVRIPGAVSAGELLRRAVRVDRPDRAHRQASDISAGCLPPMPRTTTVIVGSTVVASARPDRRRPVVGG